MADRPEALVSGWPHPENGRRLGITRYWTLRPSSIFAASAPRQASVTI